MVFILWFTSYTTYIEQFGEKIIGASLPLIGFMTTLAISADSSPKLIGSGGLITVLLWLNSNLFLERYFPQKTVQLFADIRRPFERMPYDKALLLFPFNALKSALLWIFLLPLRSGLYLERSKEYGVFVEMALFGFLAVFSLYPYSQWSYLLFFPAILLSCAVYQLIKIGVWKKLKSVAVKSGDF